MKIIILNIHWHNKYSFYLAFVFIWGDSKAESIEIMGRRFKALNPFHLSPV